MSIPAGQLSEERRTPRPAAADDVLIEIRNLKTHFHTDRGVVRAVDGVDLVIRRNRTLGVVGESGCGKSIMALSIMGLVPSRRQRSRARFYFTVRTAPSSTSPSWIRKEKRSAPSGAPRSR